MSQADGKAPRPPFLMDDLVELHTPACCHEDINSWTVLQADYSGSPTEPRERGLQDTPDLKSDPPAMSSQSYRFLTVVPQAGYLHCVPLFPPGEVGL